MSNSHSFRVASLFSCLTVLASCEYGSGTPATYDLTFPQVDGGVSKDDAFGRSLVGAPDPYVPVARDRASMLELEQRLGQDVAARRAFGWELARKVLEPVPLLGLADRIGALGTCPPAVEDHQLDRCTTFSDSPGCEAEQVDGFSVCAWVDGACAPACDNLTLPDGQAIPTVPRFTTWYGIEDLSRIFKQAYGALPADQQLARSALPDTAIGEAFHATHTQIDRLNNWPLRRYTKAVRELFECTLQAVDGESDEDVDARCARLLQSQFSGAAGSGGGIGRILYSPAAARHALGNYARVLDCADDALSDTWCATTDDCQSDADNFSTCFEAEFPADAGSPYKQLGLPAVGGTAIIKATWARVGFGFALPAYDTDAEALIRRNGPGATAHWQPDGDRSYDAPAAGFETTTFPTPADIYTIQTRGGSFYRLTGLHVMTKDTRHWTWVSLWWSDRPNDDFGADRPPSFAGLPEQWSNYKMCVVTDYLEQDAESSTRLSATPSLQAAWNASTSTGAPTWCSNPYIEHEEGNARTNCIGCHQHAGTRVGRGGDEFELDAIIKDDARFPDNGRTKIRNTFATDYSWAFSRMDDVTALFRREVEFRNSAEPKYERLKSILARVGDPAAGEAVFRQTSAERACTDCHGEAGQGGLGPSLEARFAARTNWELLYAVVEGRGRMPSWGEALSDTQLADLMAYLQQSFGPMRP